MKSNLVRAFILFTIFTLGLIIGGHYAKEVVVHPEWYVSNTPVIADGTELSQAELDNELNVLSEAGKTFATFVTWMIQSFVQWVVQVIP